MHREYTAVVKKDSGWWIGWIAEIPGVNCQEATREELIESLRITLREALAREMADGYRAEAEDSSLDPEWSEVETEGL
jgi:predicted RNase H-like HicB family nuclease